MPTLFNRIYAYHKTHNVPLLSIEQRQELGIKIKPEYNNHKGRIGKPLLYITAKPYDCDGSVIYYPVEFRGVMDVAIDKYYKTIKAIALLQNAGFILTKNNG